MIYVYFWNKPIQPIQDFINKNQCNNHCKIHFGTSWLFNIHNDGDDKLKSTLSKSRNLRCLKGFGSKGRTKLYIFDAFKNHMRSIFNIGFTMKLIYFMNKLISNQIRV